MYDCVTGKQIENSTGCIMADEMVQFNVFEFILYVSLMLLQASQCCKFYNVKYDIINYGT